MKKLLFILLVFFANSMFARQTDVRQDGNSTSFKVEIPADFFNGMFRVPDDKYLVAWHGSVNVVSVTASNGGKEFGGSIQPFVKQLSAGFKRIYYTYFIYNMKDGEKEIVTEDRKKWVAQCGLKAGRNVTISPLNGKEMTGFPPDITSDVWSKSYSFKRSYPDPETHKTIVVQYRVEATSVYFYHKKPTDLKGKITRDDKYHLCGSMVFKRLGPGINGRGFETQAKIEDDQYVFKDKLFRGDYQVSFRWPQHGGEIKFDRDFIYNPTDSRLTSDFEMSPMFTGDISGKVTYKATNKPVKNYPVKLKPVCEQSGLPEKEVFTDGQGEYIFQDIPAGEYYVSIKGAGNKNAFLTHPNEKKVIVENAEVSSNNEYEIYAYYNAPGFAKVSLKWPASRIAFPAEGASPQVVSYQTLLQANPNAKMEDFHDDNGEPLHFPFTIVYPQQRHTIYGGPGEDGTTVLYVGTLGGNGFYKNFDVKLSSDALNTCEISRENNGPIYLSLGFDLYGGAGQRGPNHQISPNWEQLTVTAWDPKTFRMMGQKMKHNPWPVDFPPIFITKEDIEKFKAFEKVEKTVSNGRATLKVMFQPAERKK